MQKLPLHAAAAVLSVATILAVLSPIEALARIKGPVFDTHGIQCLKLQNDGDALREEYKTASDARREEIIAELRVIGSDWIALKCRAAYGSIAIVRPPKTSDEYQPPVSLTEGSGGSPVNPKAMDPASPPTDGRFY